MFAFSKYVTYRRETPAWATSALVLDRRNQVMFTPINFIGNLNVGRSQEHASNQSSVRQHTLTPLVAVHDLHKLVAHQIGKMVQLKTVVLLAFQVHFVVLGDHVLVLHEHFESEVIFVLTIDLLVHLLENIPFFLEDILVRDCQRRNKGKAKHRQHAQNFEVHVEWSEDVDKLH